nr:hypothetical protein [Deltaproteobacteria bacterium]
LALVFLTFNLTSWLWLGMPVVDPLRVVPVLLIVVALIGAFSLSQRVHGVLAVLVLAILVLATFWFFYRPGDFVSLWVSPK